LTCSTKKSGWGAAAAGGVVAEALGAWVLSWSRSLQVENDCVALKGKLGLAWDSEVICIAFSADLRLDTFKILVIKGLL
jgi:hypothetical protein